jgi:hypothetical protein
METNLKAEGFQELSSDQHRHILGGALPFLIGLGIAAAGAAIQNIITDWDNFKNGLTGEPEVKN